MTDPEAARRACALGVGARFAGTVGACADRLHGDPVAIDGIVYETVQDNYPHACVIACVDSSECPTAMGCSAGICAYPTFN